MVIPVILAGGSGSRLWPISRSEYPKQLLRLLGQHTLLQETILRFSDSEKWGIPVVICNKAHRFLISEQLQAIHLSSTNIILEPIPKNTAPAAAIAALYVSQHQLIDPIILILPADHWMADPKKLSAAIETALPYVEQGLLAAFGITPNRAETGYGYIRAQGMNSAAYKITEFIEKPDQASAEKFLDTGQYYWNSGMFLFKASTYLSELNKYAPLILKNCQQAIHCMTKVFEFLMINEEIFKNCPNVSIDYAVMEKTQIGVLIPINTDWSDIGSWSNLWDIKDKDQNGNVIEGDVLTENVKDSYICSENRIVAAVGVTDHIIVETADAVLVAHKNHSQSVKKMVNLLQASKRPELALHRKVYRPWGHYEIVDQGPYFQVKRISVKPGGQLSLQMHHRRSEHWVVVRGKASVTRGNEVYTIEANESTYIPKHIKHRLANHTEEPLEIIEVQSGDYLGEDDIVRFEDTYGRVEFESDNINI